MPAITLLLYANGPYKPPEESHRILQAVVYRMISENEDLHDELHDRGIGLRNVYKLFTFSDMQPNTYGGESIFQTFRFEIRSADSRMIEAVTQYVIKRDALQVGKQYLSIQSIKLTDTLITANDISIRMITPVTMHHTNEQKHRQYISPLDAEFEEMLNQNYVKKYMSYYNSIPAEPLSIRVISETLKQDMTTFKGTIMKGYYGCFALQGLPNGLTLLYNSGIGASNTQGFGMFDLI